MNFLRTFIIPLALMLMLLPAAAQAQLTVPQGGTGQSSFTADYILYGVSSLRLGSESTLTYDPDTNTFTTTNGVFTTATSTTLCLTGDDCITEWPTGGGGSFDATAEDALTWSDGANASNIWTFDVSGTDTTITFGSDLFTFGGSLTVATGKSITLGSTQWNSGDSIDGEAIANDSIDDDSIDFADVTLADLTFDVGSVDTTEYGYLNGVTSAIQTQINAKQGTLSNEAGLYAALSDVTQFWEAGDTINSGAIDGEIISNDTIDDDSIDFADVTLNDFTNDSGFITSTLTEEEVEDYVGGMLGGTETGISVTYQDSTNDIDFVVALGTAIDSTEITDDTIQAVDLEATNTEADNDLITYDSSTGGFTFESGPELCVAITGDAGLCDGVDNTAGGGSGLATSTAIVDTYITYGTSPSTVGAEAAFTYDDSTDTLTVGDVVINSLAFTFADAGADAVLGWDDTASAYENLTAGEVLTIVGGAANDFDASGDVTITEADISDLSHTADEVGTLTTGDLCVNDGSSVNCTVNTEAELESALDALDVVTVTAGDISSADLRSILSDETGTGIAYFVGGALGTPSSGVGSNLTSLNATQLTTGTIPAARIGANTIDTITEIAAALKDGSGACSSGLLCLGGHTHAISTEVSGLGTGVATWLATPSTANLAAAVTGETGSGALVFGTSPTLVTPALGTISSGVGTALTALNGENIQDDTIDDDSIDWADVGFADITDSIAAGQYGAATIDGDDINSNIAGRSLTLTAASPDTLDIDAEIYTDTKCIWFEDPTSDDDFNSIWANKSAGDYLLTEIWGESDQTVNFDLQIDDGTPADVNGTDISPAAGEAEDTSLSGDTTLAAGEELDLAITSVSGTPTYVSVCWTYTKND